MDCIHSHDDPDPDPYLSGTFFNSNGDTVTLNPDGHGGCSCTVGVSGLATFNGNGSYNGNDVVYMMLDDPNGGILNATFDGSTLTFYRSDWELLPSGTSFYGF